jgi:hypothetical protein
MSDPLSGAAADYNEKIKETRDKLAAAIEAKAQLALAEDPVALRVEYQVAVDIIKLLSDIRFRCLTFVTAVTAVATAFASTADPGMRPALGVLGLLATLGITVYELRNSQLYEVATHRAKMVERRLRMSGGLDDVARVGLFGGRPSYVRKPPNKPAKERFMRFWLIPVKHDHGLALIYGAALGAWVYLVVYGLLSLPVPASLWGSVSVGHVRLIAALLGSAVCAWSIYEFIHHDRNRLKQQRLPGGRLVQAR